MTKPDRETTTDRFSRKGALRDVPYTMVAKLVPMVATALHTHTVRRTGAAEGGRGGRLLNFWCVEGVLCVS